MLVAATVISCNLNATYHGQNEDKKDAEDIANALYGHIIDSNYVEAHKLFSKKFFEATPKDSLNKIFLMTRKHLGSFKNNKLIDWKTQHVVGTDPKTEYVVAYEVEYSNHIAMETISMLKEKDSVKIIGYHVNSNGFLKE